MTSQTPLCEAAKAGDLAQVRRVLRQGGGDVRERDEFNNTALMWAACEGHAEVSVSVFFWEKCVIVHCKLLFCTVSSSPIEQNYSC